jgi:hypothetical protein
MQLSPRIGREIPVLGRSYILHRPVINSGLVTDLCHDIVV